MRNSHMQRAIRPHILVHFSLNCPIGPGRALEGFIVLPPEKERVYAAASLRDALRLEIGENQFLLGRLPDDRWAMVGKDEGGYRFAIEKRPSAGAARTWVYGHISEITPLEMEKAQGLLRELFAHMTQAEYEESGRLGLQRARWREELLAKIQ
jgi:hypothetical protein